MYIKEKLLKLGFEEITPIQAQVFEQFEKPKHLVGLAPTGTGKTHAYLLPILAHVNKDYEQVQAIICVPTNELVLQVYDMLKAVDDEIIAKAYIGGKDKQNDIEWLKKRQPQVVISTPFRLAQYAMDEGVLKLFNAKYMVFDEADMMFDEDFLSMIDPMVNRMKQAKFLLFSASITPLMEPFIKHYFGLYDYIDTSKGHKLDIDYQLIHIKEMDRLVALNHLIKTIQPYLCLVFVSKKEDQSLIYQNLHEQGLQVCNYSLDLPMKRRKQMIDDIRALKYQYVITSDVIARGLDFDVSHVIHYDLPYHLEFFTHRSGRTGRMYANGVVMTLMQLRDHRKIEKLSKQIKFSHYQLNPNGNLQKRKQKSSTISEEEKQAIKSIKKPKKVKPNYKKKYKKEVDKAKKTARRKKYYAKNR
ncbi:DEAD/DEAH box helicase [Mycoplasmatota bacterium]|nr:DEAD/DEAH box helicase [Mycoplasmatota bacterium]